MEPIYNCAAFFQRCVVDLLVNHPTLTIPVHSIYELFTTINSSFQGWRFFSSLPTLLASLSFTMSPNTDDKPAPLRGEIMEHTAHPTSEQLEKLDSKSTTSHVSKSPVPQQHSTWVSLQLTDVQNQLIRDEADGSSPPDLQNNSPASSSNVQPDKIGTMPCEDEHPRYAKLDPAYTKSMTWSNDPRDLANVVFSERKPNLSSDFKIPDLRPILKEEDDEDPWILYDANGMLYLWDELDGRLSRVRDHWVQGSDLDSVESKVDNIICNVTWVEDDAVRIFLPTC